MPKLYTIDELEQSSHSPNTEIDPNFITVDPKSKDFSQESTNALDTIKTEWLKAKQVENHLNYQIDDAFRNFLIIKRLNNNLMNLTKKLNFIKNLNLKLKSELNRSLLKTKERSSLIEVMKRDLELHEHNSSVSKLKNQVFLEKRCVNELKGKASRNFQLFSRKEKLLKFLERHCERS
eukprot:snap_masked-scaffold_2-processed-gene-16.12-mRNA-1 protein AED:1.00 eAED:1.00 QI:0/-1/0/0/-1/1/1/0/177